MSYAAPLHFKIGGPVPAVSVVLQPLFPTHQADGVAMVRQRVPGRGLCFDGDASDKVLIEGHVQSVMMSFGPGGTPNPTILPFGPAAGGGNRAVVETSSAALPVKLGVEVCGFPGYTWIDSDSSLIMRAGEMSIDVYAPPNWVLLPSDVEFQEEQTWMIAEIRVTACPVKCCYPPLGVLTHHFFADPITPTPVTVTRPRRARRMQFFTTTASLVEFYDGDPAAGGVLIGDIIVGPVAGTATEFYPLGAWTHLIFYGGGGNVYPVTLRWEIG